MTLQYDMLIYLLIVFIKTFIMKVRLSLLNQNIEDIEFNQLFKNHEQTIIYFYPGSCAGPFRPWVGDSVQTNAPSSDSASHPLHSKR